MWAKIHKRIISFRTEIEILYEYIVRNFTKYYLFKYSNKHNLKIDSQQQPNRSVPFYVSFYLDENL